jgi:phosphohistidine phosphatase
VPGQEDFDRQLNDRGRKSAAMLALHLQRKSIRPDIILCSAAKRTRQTHENMLSALVGIPVFYEKRLYLAHEKFMLERLRKLDDRVKTVLMIAHNPGTENLAMLMVDPDSGGDLAGLGRLQDKYPTCGFTALSAFVDNWASLSPGLCRIEAFVSPRDLGG